MEIQEKMRKLMLEAKYLNVENTDRYRPIIRLFYLKYEKLKYWLYQEEVFEELKEDPYFADYTMEQCQQDLTALASWGNLVTIQDTRKVTTIEEFKNKSSGTSCRRQPWKSSVWSYESKICLLKALHWNRLCWSGFGSIWENWKKCL